MAICFNPRAPCGARREQLGLIVGRLEFQSTRPMRGATVKSVAAGLPNIVSIHAPHAGRDQQMMRSRRRLLCFNPRAPCGARPAWTSAQTDHCLFQSTRPVWGATNHAIDAVRYGTVSIHAPRVGRDVVFPEALPPPNKFQSTRPVWGATEDWEAGRGEKRVSIHAPRVGRDSRPQSKRSATTCFNPRAPCGARPAVFQPRNRIFVVSIHAPRVGRDLSALCDGRLA